MKTELSHPFPPVYNSESVVLILGSFPSVKSREDNFFYGHPKNRFWKVISSVLSAPLPITTEEKRNLLLENNIALWDVIASCEIKGSSDASISRVVPNNLRPLLETANIKAIFCNGQKAQQLYTKHLQAHTGIYAESLPSTSPANATWSTEKLIEVYSKMLSPYLQIKCSNTTSCEEIS